MATLPVCKVPADVSHAHAAGRILWPDFQWHWTPAAPPVCDCESHSTVSGLKDAHRVSSWNSVNLPGEGEGLTQPSWGWSLNVQGAMSHLGQYTTPSCCSGIGVL